MHLYRIVFLNGPEKGRRMAVQRRSLFAGSDYGCALWVDDETVAPRQAEIRADPETGLTLHVQTPGAVRVNEQPATTAPVPLSDGDRLDIGPRAVRIRIPRAASRGRRLRTLALAALALSLILPAWNAWRPSAPVSPPDKSTPASPGALPDRLFPPDPELAEMEALHTQPGATPETPPEIAAPPAAPRRETTTGTEAEAERRRQAERLLEQSRLETERPFTEPNVSHPRIQFVRVTPQRFPATENVEEIRLFRFTLAPERPGPIPGRVSLDVRFYERGTTTHTLRPAEAVITPSGPIRFPVKPWPPEGETVEVHYVVPHGLRGRQRRESGEPYAYAGFVARVYVDGVLHDQTARPTALRALIDASP